jgi:hypothetical protein
MLALEITSKINNVLASISTSFSSQNIQAIGIALIPSKDLKLYVCTREQA